MGVLRCREGTSGRVKGMCVCKARSTVVLRLGPRLKRKKYDGGIVTMRLRMTNSRANHLTSWQFIGFSFRSHMSWIIFVGICENRDWESEEANVKENVKWLARVDHAWAATRPVGHRCHHHFHSLTSHFLLW